MRRYVRREVLLNNNANVSNQNITLNDEREEEDISKDKIKSIYTELQEKTSYKVERYE
jgi:hypothetical protein